MAIKKQNLSLLPPRGMRDFYPEDFRRRQRLFSVWQEAAREFGFEQYEASVVESLDLLKRKAGEEIMDQIYAFSDKSGRQLALRPELTPSLMRMVLARGSKMPLPIKWFSIAQCFRYERMTKGRKREHYQWNLDVLGEDSQLAEAEVIAVAVSALEKLGLTSDHFIVKLGNRQFLYDLLDNQGFNMSKFATAYLVLDKQGKISDSTIKTMLKEEGVNTKDIHLILDVLQIKNLQQAKKLALIDSLGIQQTESLLKAAESFGISKYLEFDISTVRGLSYYTGPVFEAFDREGKFRAIFGGGRYDNFFSSMGGNDLAAVGLGFGDIVVEEVLKHYGKKQELKRRLDYVVGYTDKSLEVEAIKLSQSLRAKDKTAFLFYGSNRMGKILSLADKIGADNAAILDPREFQKGSYLVKNLVSGKQENVKF